MGAAEWPGSVIQAGMLGTPDTFVLGSASGDSETTSNEPLSRPAAVLADMLTTIQRDTPNKWMAFGALVHVLGDAARLQPLERELRSVADAVLPSLKAFVTALEDEDQPFDPLGEVFTHAGVADEDGGGGQVLTPRYICEYINDQTVGRGLDEIASGAKTVDQPFAVLDPAAGTGRFPIDLCQRYGTHQQDIHPVQVYAVEKNIWLYRACLVNLRVLAPYEPVLVLWGDALLLDLLPGSPNWMVANRWYPVDWRQLIPAPGIVDAEKPRNLDGLSLACGGPEPADREYVTWPRGESL